MLRGSEGSREGDEQARRSDMQLIERELELLQSRQEYLDSIAVLYRLEEEKDIKELGRQMAKLLRIARKFDVPVLITNQIYTDIETGRSVPIGGDVIRYWAKISIELDKQDSIRTAILKKHKFLPENMRMDYRITERGMEDCPR